MKELDLIFIEEKLAKYRKHMEGVRKHLEIYIENMQRQVASLEKLDQGKYGTYKKECQFKLAEALEKLAHVEPTIQKLTEQLEILKEKNV